MYTDIYGMIPYTEASDPDIVTPVYDTQAVIYQGVIDELNEAMQIIGEHVDTGTGPEYLSSNDLFYNINEINHSIFTECFLNTGTNNIKQFNDCKNIAITGFLNDISTIGNGDFDT